jgi:hypothetical protein
MPKEEQQISALVGLTGCPPPKAPIEPCNFLLPGRFPLPREGHGMPLKRS